jgi:hypothetical protein
MTKICPTIRAVSKLSNYFNSDYEFSTMRAIHGFKPQPSLVLYAFLLRFGSNLFYKYNNVVLHSRMREINGQAHNLIDQEDVLKLAEDF